MSAISLESDTRYALLVGGFGAFSRDFAQVVSFLLYVTTEDNRMSILLSYVT